MSQMREANEHLVVAAVRAQTLSEEVERASTSRISNGGIRLAVGPVDLAAAALGALDAVRPLAATKKVHLAFDDLPGSRMVCGDAERLQQVILNLLANTIKFTPEGGRVDVFIESATEHMEVRVVDTGQGTSVRTSLALSVTSGVHGPPSASRRLICRGRSAILPNRSRC